MSHSFVVAPASNRFAILKVSSVVLAVLIATFSITPVLADQSRAPELETITFIDTLRPAHEGGHEEAEGDACESTSSSFKTIRGGIRWTKTTPVTYSVDMNGYPGANPAAALSAIEAAAQSWDDLGDGISFLRVNGNADVTVLWDSMDGPSGTLAATGISFNPATKTIVSATLTLDSDDDWTVYDNPPVCNAQLDGQDVENVGAHEFGHVIGFAHVNDDVDLTMYPYITQEGETRKRTLGSGEWEGFAALYLPDSGGSDPDDGGNSCPPGHARRKLC